MRLQGEKLGMTGCRTTPAVLLCSLVVALLAAQPILPMLHMAFADHQHRLNPASGIFEDVIVIGGDSGDTESSEIERSLSSTLLPSSGRRVVYAYCLESNCCHLRYTVAVRDDIVGDDRVLEPASAGVIRDEVYRQIPLIAAAPKNSPPVA